MIMKQREEEEPIKGFWGVKSSRFSRIHVACGK